MTTPSLFDDVQPAERKHHGVQRTSVLAAVKEKALLDRRQKLALGWLIVWCGKGWPYPTSLELAKHNGVPVLQVRIGLSDLKRRGYVENGPARKCQVSGHKSLVWKVRTR